MSGDEQANFGSLGPIASAENWIQTKKKKTFGLVLVFSLHIAHTYPNPGSRHLSFASLN